MSSIDPIRALIEEHAALSQLFARHQMALVARSWARAARLLKRYQERLHNRIMLEERFLLPYCVKSHIPGHWQVYVTEHQLLEEILESASRRLAAARRRGITNATLIALLDEEKTAKYALEHHLKQEDMEFSITLGQTLPDEVRKSLVHVLVSTGNDTLA